MLNRKVERAVFITFKILSLLKVLPFDFDYSRQLFVVPTLKSRLAFQLVQNVLLLSSPLHGLYMLYELRKMGAGVMAVGSTLVHIASVTSSASYLIDLTLNKETVVSLFNRTITFNKKFGGHSKKGQSKKWADPLRLNWFMIFLPFFYIAMVLAMFFLVVNFQVKQNNSFSLYGLLPDAYQNLWTLIGFVVLDMFLSITRSATWIFQVHFQGFVLTSFCYWAKRISSDMAKDSKDLYTKLKMHAGLQILLAHFNQAYLKAIVTYKTSCLFCAIGCCFLLIRFSATMDLQTFGFQTVLAIACIFWPPLIYGNAFKIHHYSVIFKGHEALLGINHVKEEERKAYFRRRVDAIKPIEVKVGKVYFLDSSFTPLYVSYTMDKTISLLLM